MELLVVDVERAADSQRGAAGDLLDGAYISCVDFVFDLPVPAVCRECRDDPVRNS